MFVALQAKDRTRVTSIASQWDERLEVLRELTSGGHLICPGCEQRLWLRIGIKRRRHFAHRHLADCPLGNQSAEVLEAKAQMFEWLEKKYPGKVNLDLTIGVPGWSKVIDLLVEAEPGRKFAYWIFDRQQRSREEILAH
jgi:competence CoiA-like predicted nuclease